MKDLTGNTLTHSNFTWESTVPGAIRGAGFHLFEYVDKSRESSVSPSSQKHHREKKVSTNKLQVQKKVETRRQRRNQDGGQTEDPHGERETQQEHHSARERGQVNGEFDNSSVLRGKVIEASWNQVQAERSSSQFKVHWFPLLDQSEAW